MHNRVDLALIFDTTASMGSVLQASKQGAVSLLTRLASANAIDLKGALIDYRDHLPQEYTYVYKHHTNKQPVDLGTLNRAIHKMDLGHGGDMAESVLDGVNALREIEWRPHSLRLAVVFGDAPGHGHNGGVGDTWPGGCPCGLTITEVTAQLEQAGIILHAAVVSNSEQARTFFTELATGTGGDCVVGTSGSMASLEQFVSTAFAEVVTDGMVYEYVKDTKVWDLDALSEALSLTRGDVDRSLRRLYNRDLITPE